MGYFYDPNVPSLDPTNRKSRQLRACEWTHSRSAGYRAMLYANGDAIFTPDRDFQSALNLVAPPADGLGTLGDWEFLG